jgi:hypothetical protein
MLLKDTKSTNKKSQLLLRAFVSSWLDTPLITRMLLKVCVRSCRPVGAFELTFSEHAGHRLRACSRRRIRAGARRRVRRDERHASFTDAHLFDASERNDDSNHQQRCVSADDDRDAGLARDFHQQRYPRPLHVFQSASGAHRLHRNQSGWRSRSRPAA